MQLEGVNVKINFSRVQLLFECYFLFFYCSLIARTFSGMPQKTLGTSDLLYNSYIFFVQLDVL